MPNHNTARGQSRTQMCFHGLRNLRGPASVLRLVPVEPQGVDLLQTGTLQALAVQHELVLPHLQTKMFSKRASVARETAGRALQVTVCESSVPEDAAPAQ